MEQNWILYKLKSLVIYSESLGKVKKQTSTGYLILIQMSQFKNHASNWDRLIDDESHQIL